ncbi:MAG: histone deacetylase [Myxococcaceae bacterium]|nr:histone deacetylase [Myxococcaceae bacterium]
MQGAGLKAGFPRLTAFYSDAFMVDIGQHVMPMRKFGLVKQAVVRRGLAPPVLFSEPTPATDEDLLRVHTPEYVAAIASGEPRALAESQKFPWSTELARAVRLTNGAAIGALSAALDDGVACAVASGYHHAHADHGEGFCTFNGLVVALEHARAHGRIKRGLVIDLDLHYGNGTASLLASRPDFHTLSIYGSWYKANKATPDVYSERAKDTDNARSIAVTNGATGSQYLEILDGALGDAIDRARPDVLLYQAGADPYREDPYSPLDVGVADLEERDTRVFMAAKASGIPIAWVLAGGYTKDVTKVVEVHTNTFAAAVRVFTGS